MDLNHKDPDVIFLYAPRLARYKQKKWKRHQGTVYSVDFQTCSTKNGLKFHQTRCNVIIFYDTLLAYFIIESRCDGIWRNHLREYSVSPRPPPTISFKDNCMNDLDSEVAGSSKDTQRIQPKPKTQLSRTGRAVGGQESTKEIEKGILFDHEDIKHSTRTERDP